jgi:hypothetical protein
VLKLLYLCTSGTLLICFACFGRATYDREGDRFCKLALLLPALAAALHCPGPARAVTRPRRSPQ